MPDDGTSSIPLAFRETLIRIQEQADRGEAPVGASIMPDGIEVTPRDLVTESLPVEAISREGKQVVITDSGEPAYGDPAAGAHYELLDMLGRGGMGIVISARQESLQREVAMKIARGISTDTADTSRERLELFANEALITANLEHPGVVPVYTLARDPTGHLFFTMKRVSGISWDHLLTPESIRSVDERRLARSRAKDMTFEDHLDILMKVADAVAYAHAKGVLHRDLKPDNVMIGAFGEVLLMDWGLAMPFGARNPYVLDPDKKAQLVGTPGYLPPEMATGRMCELGPGTDVYELGGILYRLLTRRPPHHAGEVMAAVERSAAGQVDPPAACDGAEVNPELSRITMKALAARIDDRYPTVGAFQEDLKRYRANAESIAVATGAHKSLEELDRQLGSAGKISEHEAARAMAGLSECIGAFQQAMRLWPENEAARKGRSRTLSLQIHLALARGDLTVARAHLDTLGELVKEEPKLGAKLQRYEARFETLSRQKDQVERRTRLIRRLVVVVVVLIILGIGGALYFVARQRSLAQENLRLSEGMHKRMFAQAVAARAAVVSGYMQGIEQLVSQYQAEAVRLMTLDPESLAPRPRTAAGRDGFYLDADYYDPKTAPADVSPNQRYGFAVSAGNVTTLVGASAQADTARGRALQDITRLSRLDTRFSQAHRARGDVLWSLTGTRHGAFISYPGSGRFRDKPDYDPTRRPWYLATIDAEDDRPRWVHPHIDAGGQGLIISCMSRVLVGEGTIGVVGLELPLSTMQEMLQQFTREAGGDARGLLVRPGGNVVIDTRYQAGDRAWQERFETASIDSLGPDLAAYYQDAAAGKLEAGSTRTIETSAGKRLVSHARLQHHDWMLVVLIEPRDVLRGSL